MARRQRTKEEYIAEMNRNAKGNTTKGTENKRKYMDYTKIEGGVTFFTPIPEHKHSIDIIPFVPTVGKYPGEVNGEDKYALSVFIHKNVGPNNEWHICPKKTYGKPCPICDFISEQFDNGTFEDGKNKEYLSIKASQRTIMNIIDLEDENKRKVFDYSNYYWNANLANKIKNRQDDESFIDLYDIKKGGPTIKFVPAVSDYVSTGKKVYAGSITDIDFVARQHSYTDDVIEDAPKLDTCIHLLSFDELKDILYGEVDEDIEEMDDEAETSKETFTTPVTDTIKESVDIAPNAFVEPPKTLTREERLAARKNKAAKPDGPVCPYGYEFGTDNYGDGKPDCDKCEVEHPDIMAACSKKYEELLK